MSIQSRAFGRVTLTGEDAKTFKRQVAHGKPKKAAAATVKRGVILSREFQEYGCVVVATPPAKKTRARR